MKNLENFLKAILLAGSLLLANSCASNPQTITKYIYVCPDLYFAKFPDPSPIIPLDEKCHVVKDDNTKIEYYLIPKFYGELVLDYKLSNDETKARYETFKRNIEKAQIKE